jgi:hypothetical protein
LIRRSPRANFRYFSVSFSVSLCLCGGSDSPACA